MTGALQQWIVKNSPLPVDQYPKRREGRMLKFTAYERSLGRPRYNVQTVRGEQFSIGVIEYRNQWGYFAFKADPDVPMNREILGEIYAMLKELKS